MSWLSGQVVALDLETTSVRLEEALPVSYAALLVDLATGWETGEHRLVRCGPVPAEAIAIHGISAERCEAEGVDLEEATARLADVLITASRRGVPVLGANLRYDLGIIDRLCRGLLDQGGLLALGWEPLAIDVTVLDRHLDPDRQGGHRLRTMCHWYEVSTLGAHDAASDARMALAVALAMGARDPELAGMEAGDLHRAQVLWHRTWAQAQGWPSDEAAWPLPVALEAA